MQCSSCSFQNMPGSESCARCGSSLRVATMVMDVHPPRRRQFSGKVRRLRDAGRKQLRIIQWWHQHRIAALTAGAQRLDRPDASRALQNRLMVPGWSHLYAGQRWQGHLLLWSFFASLFTGLWNWGTTLGMIGLLAAFVIHQIAVLDVFHQYMPGSTFGERLSRPVLTMIVVAVCLYVLPYLLLREVAEPMRLQVPIGPFHTNDVVLINHWWPVRAGQVVIFEEQEDTVDTGLAMHRERIRLEVGGRYIDRVIAVGGDRVVLDRGQLKVNGEKSSWRPLNPGVLPNQMSLTVPSDDVLVFPTTLEAMNAGGALDWESLGCIPKSAVDGCVYRIYQPRSRSGPVE